MFRLTSIAIAVLLMCAQCATADEDVLKNLKHDHPRLYRTEAQWAQLKKDIRDNRTLQRWFITVWTEADDIRSTPPEWPLDGQVATMTCRNTAARMATIAGIYRLTKANWAGERAKAEVLAVAALPSWEPGGLGCGEMTYAEGLGYDWTYELLSDEERAKVRKAIIENGIKPSLEVIRKKQRWANRGGNWPEVCNGGVIVGALAIADEEPDIAREAITMCRANLNKVLSEYNPDGGWAEGPGYWHYGTGYLVRTVAALQSAIGDDLGICATPGLENTGFFRLHTCNPFDYCFNFGDCDDFVYPAPWMFWLAKQYHHPEFAAEEARIFHDRPTIFHLIWSDGLAPASEVPQIPPDALFRNIDLTCFRSAWDDPSATYLGFKCGFEGGHGHLDYGSFILDSQQERWAIDLGREQYIPGYFGPTRYSFFRASNRAHNTLTINDGNEDPKARSRIIAFSSTPQKAFAVGDLTKTWHITDGSIRRGVALLDRRDVLVQDEIQAGQPLDVVWNMYTRADIDAHEGRAALSQRGAKLYVRILSPTNGSFEIAPADAPPPQTQQPDAHALRIHLKTVAAEPTRIAVLLTPAQETPPPAIESLDDWVKAAPMK